MRSLVPWFVVGLCVQALVALALGLWARRVARRLGGRRFRRAAWLPVIALALNLGGVAAAAALAARVPPSPGPLGPEGRRAWRMQWAGAGAVGLGSAALAALLYGASAVTSLAGTVRAASAATAGAVSASTAGAASASTAGPASATPKREAGAAAPGEGT